MVLHCFKHLRPFIFGIHLSERVLGYYPSSCVYLKCPVSLSKHNVSETGFRLSLQVKPTHCQLGPIHIASSKMGYIQIIYES
jgi:hypothetical protein